MATAQPWTNPSPNSSVARVRCVKTDIVSTDTFPAGLRVLVVDDDPICLLILDRMLRCCLYQVTTCGKAIEALQLLREKKDGFDLLISDVVMPGMDGFKLLELVGLEMDLPVISKSFYRGSYCSIRPGKEIACLLDALTWYFAVVMSANGEVSTVMKGIKHGACDYLLKPVRMEELRNIWQHVVRKKWRMSRQDYGSEEERSRHPADDGDYISNECFDAKTPKRRREKEEEEDADPDNEDSATTKRPRVVWSVDLHQQFVNAVNQLGIDKAVPKRILELMNVQGLTRENVASHLQKYRLYLKRISCVAHQSGGFNPSFPGPGDSGFGSLAGDISVLGRSGQLSPQALMSSLQTGLLGRLGQQKNLDGLGRVNPLFLLQVAALQQPEANNLRSSYGTYTDPESKHLRVFQQLGPFAGSVDRGAEGMPSLHQLQPSLIREVGLGDIGQLQGAHGNSQMASSSHNPFLMQAIHQQDSSDLLKSGGANLSLSTGIQPSDVGGWSGSSANTGTFASGAASSNSSARVFSLLNLVSRRAADKLFNASSIEMPVPCAASPVCPAVGPDEMGVANFRSMGSALGGDMLLPNSINYSSKFIPPLNAQSENNPLTWQVFESNHEVNTFILNPRYGREEGQLQNQVFNSTNSAVDAGLQPYATNLSSVAQHLAVDCGRQVEDKIKQEPTWVTEPLSDDLLNIVLKQA